MGEDADADGSSEQRSAKPSFNEEPREECADGSRRHRMRKWHVREMNVRDAVDGRFGCGALDAGIVESDPRELHCLDREEQRYQGCRRKASLDHKRGGCMVNSKHVVLQRRSSWQRQSTSI